MIKPRVLDIEIAEGGKKLWVNADGVCQFRADLIEKLVVTDTRKYTLVWHYGGAFKYESYSEAITAFESKNPEARYDTISLSLTKCYADMKSKLDNQIIAILMSPWPIKE